MVCGNRNTHGTVVGKTPRNVGESRSLMGRPVRDVTVSTDLFTIVTDVFGFTFCLHVYPDGIFKSLMTLVLTHSDLLAFL